MVWMIMRIVSSTVAMVMKNDCWSTAPNDDAPKKGRKKKKMTDILSWTQNIKE